MCGCLFGSICVCVCVSQTRLGVYMCVSVFLKNTPLLQLFPHSHSWTDASPMKVAGLTSRYWVANQSGGRISCSGTVTCLPVLLSFLWQRSRCGQTVTTHTHTQRNVMLHPSVYMCSQLSFLRTSICMTMRKTNNLWLIVWINRLILVRCQKIVMIVHHKLPEPQGDVFKLLNLSDQHSQTQRYSIYNYIKAATLYIWKAGTSIFPHEWLKGVVQHFGKYTFALLPRVRWEDGYLSRVYALNMKPQPVSLA